MTNLLDVFRPKFKKTTLQYHPKVILWQPRCQRDAIIEIQDKEYRWSDDLVNRINSLAEDLTLTAENPVIPQILLNGEPFGAMQTTMAFGGTCEESKVLFVAEVVKFLDEDKALTRREELEEPEEEEKAPPKTAKQERAEEDKPEFKSKKISEEDDAKKKCSHDGKSCANCEPITCESCNYQYFPRDHRNDERTSQCPGCSNIIED